MKRWSPLVPVLLAVVVYAPAPWGDLVWDDQLVFDKQLTAFNTLGDAFFPPEGIFQWSKSYFRPVVILSYMLDVRLYGGVQAAGLHISGVIYHVITTFFVWMLARRLFQQLPSGSLGAIIAAAIFAVHPIHTESVSWITGRSDVLAAMFFVPAIAVTLRWRDTGAFWALGLGAVLYLLALLSKEVAIAALVVVPAMLMLAPAHTVNQPISGNTEGRWHRMALPTHSRYGSNIVIWLVTGAVYLGVTGAYFMLRHATGAIYGTSLEVTWLEYFARIERSVSFYLVKVLVPWSQSTYVAWDLTPGLIATTGAHVTMVGLLILSLWLWWRHRDGLPLLAMVWFGATLAPSLVVAVRMISGIALAERYLYLPSVAPALLLGIACCHPRLAKWAKPATWAVSALIVAYSVTTVERGIVWTSDLRLWTDATQKAPDHGVPWNQLGNAYLAQRDYKSALSAYLRSIEGTNSSEGRSIAKFNMGQIYHLQGDLGRAREYYLGALEQRPNNPEAHYGLGIVYMTQAENIEKANGLKRQVNAKLDLAITQFESSIRLNPYHATARWGLVSVLAHRGQNHAMASEFEQASAHYRSALAEIDSLVAQDPTFASRLDVQEKGAALKAALKQLPQ